MQKQVIPNVILLFGEEEFLIDQYYDELITILTERGINSNSIEKYDGKDIEETDIVDFSNNLSLISSQKVIVIKNFDKLYKNKRKSSKSFSEYVKNPNPDTFLILLGAPSRLNGISKELSNARKKAAAEKKIKRLPEVLNYLISNNFYKEFARVYDNQIPDWIISRSKKLSLKISPKAAALLSSAVDNNLREINQQLLKISTYKEDNSEIGIDDIEKVVGVNRKNNVFELNNKVGERNLKASIKIVDNLMSQSDHSVVIISTLSRYFTVLWKLIEERKRTTNKFQLAGKIGVSPFFVDDYLKALKYYHPNEFGNIFEALSESDEKLKSTTLDKKYLIQQLLMTIVDRKKS